jgi:integrase
LVRLNQAEVTELKKWLYSGIFEPSTERDFVVTIKRYYQWLRAPRGRYEEWRSDHHYPTLVCGLKATIKSSDRKKPTILEEEEFESLVKSTTNVMIKAFLAVAYELGLRPGELLRLLIRNVKHERVIRNGREEYRMLIDFTDDMTKTVGRRLVVQRSRILLTQWLETHPFSDDPDAPLWLGTEGGGWSAGDGSMGPAAICSAGWARGWEFRGPCTPTCSDTCRPRTTQGTT